MKLKTTLSFLVFSTLGIQAQINFEHSSFAELKQKAKSENKIIMIDAFTTWCGPCKWMASNTFTNKTVGEFYNSQFVNAKIDMEKGEGLELAKQYEVMAYPTILFVNADGKLIHRSVGAMDTTDFVTLGKDALNPEKQFGTFHDKYMNGAKDEAFLVSYIYKADAAGIEPKKAVEDYFKTQKPENYINQTNWNILREYTSKKNSPQLKYLIKNKEAFEDKYTTDSVNNKINDVYATEMRRLIYAKKFDVEAYKSTKAEFTALKLPNSEKIILQNDLALYQKNNNGALYGKSASIYFDKYASTDEAFEINEVAYNVYELCNDKAVLAKAETFAKKAVELSKNDPAVMDTYACLLFKNNKKQEAISVEKEAIKTIKANPKFDEGLASELQANIDKWEK